MTATAHMNTPHNNSAEALGAPKPKPERRCQAVWGDTPCNVRLARDNKNEFCQVCLTAAEELAQAKAHRDLVRESLANGVPRRVVPLGKVVATTRRGAQITRLGGPVPRNAHRAHHQRDQDAKLEILRGEA